MSVLLETSKGDIVIDLFVEDCPVTTKNFLKLCKIKYYNNCLFHNVQRNFIAQTGDPLGTGKGGTSIYGKMYGDQARFFDDELRPQLKHTKRGVVGMASGGKGLNASQFYITLVGELDSLDEKHTVFGQVAEGLDVLDKLNESFCDEEGLPFQNIRIRHTVILDDPFEDAPEMSALVPEGSPEPEFGQGDRLEDDWAPTEDGRSLDEIEEELRKAEARNRAVVLEMVGDLPDADSKPPPNMLFMCKLNPVTSEEDLEIIFSRFGTVTSCDIIRDMKTGDSLCYGFVTFDTDEACEAAYFKMNNVLIDDRRIKVDFSQSVHNLWAQFKTGGRKGSADMRKAADQHERGAPNASNATGGGGPSSRGGHHHHHHQLLLDEPEQQQQRVDHKRSRHVDEKPQSTSKHHRHQSDDAQKTGEHKSKKRDSFRNGDGRDNSHNSNSRDPERRQTVGRDKEVLLDGGSGGYRGQHKVKHDTMPHSDASGAAHASDRSGSERRARDADDGLDHRHASGNRQDHISAHSRQGRGLDGRTQGQRKHQDGNTDGTSSQEDGRQQQNGDQDRDGRSSRVDNHHRRSKEEPRNGKHRHHDDDSNEQRGRERGKEGGSGETRHKDSRHEGNKQEHSRKVGGHEHARSSKGVDSAEEEGSHKKNYSSGQGFRQGKQEDGAGRYTSSHHRD